RQTTPCGGEGRSPSFPVSLCVGKLDCHSAAESRKILSPTNTGPVIPACDDVRASTIAGPSRYEHRFAAAPYTAERTPPACPEPNTDWTLIDPLRRSINDPHTSGSGPDDRWRVGQCRREPLRPR